MECLTVHWPAGLEGWNERERNVGGNPMGKHWKHLDLIGNNVTQIPNGIHSSSILFKRIQVWKEEWNLIFWASWKMIPEQKLQRWGMLREGEREKEREGGKEMSPERTQQKVKKAQNWLFSSTFSITFCFSFTVSSCDFCENVVIFFSILSPSLPRYFCIKKALLRIIFFFFLLIHQFFLRCFWWCIKSWWEEERNVSNPNQVLVPWIHCHPSWFALLLLIKFFFDPPVTCLKCHLAFFLRHFSKLIPDTFCAPLTNAIYYSIRHLTT